MEPWTPSDEWIDRINKARRFFNKSSVLMVAIVFNWVVVAVSMFFALRDGDGVWLMMAIFWTIFAAYIGPRQYQAARLREEDEAASAEDASADPISLIDPDVLAGDDPADDAAIDGGQEAGGPTGRGPVGDGPKPADDDADRGPADHDGLAAGKEANAEEADK